jgi:hypothetical protein
MKLGILMLVIGVLLLLSAIPYSIVAMFVGLTQAEEGVVSGGIWAYLGIIGVIAGFALTTIGALRVFKR